MARRGGESAWREGYSSHDCNGASELAQKFQGSFSLGDFCNGRRGIVLGIRSVALRIVAVLPFESTASGQPVARMSSPAIKHRPRENFYPLANVYTD